MNQIRYSVAAGLLALACSHGPSGSGEATASSAQDLEISGSKNLTLMQDPNISSVSNEQTRQDDTKFYYTARGVNSGLGPNTPGGSVSTALPNLNTFQRHFGMSTTGTPAAGEATAVYYNRGDLGIGREMHCIDQYDALNAIACYVTNFAAGDDGTEFTFGQNADVAFRNADNHHSFATVAMVFQPTVTPHMVFLVYNAAGTALLNAATLDRVGLNYQNEFVKGQTVPAKFGTPGVDFNNHIPSNCITCHGGERYKTGTFESGGQFLPFDLDNFDFDATHTRLGQESAFRALNQIARKVAVLNIKLDSTPADVNHSIRNQIDGWYNNPSHGDVLPSCTPGQACFNSNYIPPGWLPPLASSTEAVDLYQKVIRPNCRNCHIANNRHPILAFDDEGAFSFWFNGVHNTSLSPLDNMRAGGSAVAALVTGYQMPHALQSTRQFWLSPAPTVLEAYYAHFADTNAVNTLHGATGGNLVTMDPQLINTVQLE